MKFSVPGRCALVSLVLVTVAACDSPASDEAASGPGHSDLAPTFEPEDEEAGGTGEGAAEDADEAGNRGQAAPDGRGEAATGPARPEAGDAAATGRSGERSGASAAGGAPGDGAGEPAGGDDRSGPGSDAGAPGPMRVGDPSGDLSASTESAPSSADITGVVLERSGDRVEVRTTFAGPVPTRQSGSKGMNVASFYDVDGNGYVDYEIWASLADDGWGTGYLDDRGNEASFGPSTGIRVTVRGDTLVVSFPWDRIGNARELRWSAASEWGSYESMAASTSARDRAPDQGASRYPG